jgi:hypothetical protein
VTRWRVEILGFWSFWSERLGTVNKELGRPYRDTVSQGDALESVALGHEVLDQVLVPRHVPGSAAVPLGCPARVPDGPPLLHLAAASRDASGASAVPLDSIHGRPPGRSPAVTTRARLPSPALASPRPPSPALSLGPLPDSPWVPRAAPAPQLLHALAASPPRRLATSSPGSLSQSLRPRRRLARLWSTAADWRRRRQRRPQRRPRAQLCPTAFQETRRSTASAISHLAHASVRPTRQELVRSIAATHSLSQPPTPHHTTHSLTHSLTQSLNPTQQGVEDVLGYVVGGGLTDPTLLIVRKPAQRLADYA